ncbi:MAG TPA: PQQ-binding-like beta-propeller repeat protein [Pirellulales bacterium]|nr:PQQ-binding-like beta-propeller repeat protein [Pirellulales bacterium]
MLASFRSIARVLWLVVVLVASGESLVKAEINWPGWGGPAGNSQSSETGLPLKWTADNVLWKANLKGNGQSTPVLWGQQIFLTSELENGRQRIVFSLDRRDGKLLWEQVAWTGQPEESHKMNGWASATCATNGKVVVAFFGRGGLHCFSLDGKPLWSRDLGHFDGPWGAAASPIFHGKLVIQNCDSESKESSLLAVNSETGETVWSTPRLSNRGWSTPLVIRPGEHAELVLNGHDGVRGYDPATGKELWFCKGYNGRGEPVPAYAHDLLYVINGLPGELYAVRPGGSGDVSQTHRAWHVPRKSGRDLPSPVVVDQYLLSTSMAGIMFCNDCLSGKELWKERVGASYSSSPIVSEGRAYFQNDAGETVVIKPGDKLDVVATNTLSPAADEIFRAALVPSQGQIFSRSTKALYCIGPRPGGAK